MINFAFGTSGHMSPVQECARAALVFAYGLVLMRVSGRRTFARWSALDIVVAIVVGSSLSRVLTGNSPLLGTVAATAVLMGLHWLFARASARSERVSTLIEGPAIRLAENGRLDEARVVAHNVSKADLMEALRQGGTEDVSTTRALVLEPSGKITVMR
jgi:uncharacterized membrane protein YcaP (DUF421 family)